MTQRVVDDLEAIEIREKKIEWLGAPGISGACFVQALSETRAVREACQYVMRCEVSDPLFGLLPLGHIVDNRLGEGERAISVADADAGGAGDPHLSGAQFDSD